MRPDYVERRNAMLRNRLAKLRATIAALAGEAQRDAARRAAEIEVRHIERELSELEAAEGRSG
jgi:hypothetical protein